MYKINNCHPNYYQYTEIRPILHVFLNFTAMLFSIIAKFKLFLYQNME